MFSKILEIWNLCFLFIFYEVLISFGPFDHKWSESHPVLFLVRLSYTQFYSIVRAKPINDLRYTKSWYVYCHRKSLFSSRAESMLSPKIANTSASLGWKLRTEPSRNFCMNAPKNSDEFFTAIWGLAEVRLITAKFAHICNVRVVHQTSIIKTSSRVWISFAVWRTQR